MPKNSAKTKYGTYKAHFTVSVTPEGIQGLDELARKHGLSRSELMEQIGRGYFLLTLPTSEEGQTLKKQSRPRSRDIGQRLAA